ncbi:MAG: multidrug efflux SMR transporter [Verrucomicrobiales bacterium]|jgi:quaternary ammonium compound-resistance protein SugE|nr:multidrug efflux SMR transporter [Verrucomicrobiales bacterium]MDR1305383.1 multidrug efflux SMR transporter [Verrucomicrobiales bacterium]
MSYWLLLVLAGLFEVGFTTCLKMSDGFTRLWPSAAFCVCALASFGLLTLSLKGVPLGTAYAVWTGIGAVGTALVGVWLFKDPSTTLRLVFLFGIIGCIIGLKFVAPEG